MKSHSLTITAIAAAVAAAYVLVVRPWYLRWGASEDEVRKPLPGDELVLQPKIQSTRAVTIDAPVEDVWPWLVQLGYGRGGFYSYDLLENAFTRGLGMHAHYESLASCARSRTCTRATSSPLRLWTGRTASTLTRWAGLSSAWSRRA